MSSRETLYFVGEVNPNFICGICQRVMCNPYDTSCGHTFCFACITRHSKENQSCPLCSSIFSEFTIRPTSENFTRVLESQKTFCDNKSFDDNKVKSSCDWVGEFQCLRDHLENECLFVDVKCSFGCKKTLKRFEIFQHSDECEFRNTTCKLCKQVVDKKDIKQHKAICTHMKLNCKCGNSFLRHEIQEHQEVHCTKTEIPCPFFHNNCTFVTERKSMTAHVKQAESLHELLSMASCSLSPIPKKVIDNVDDKLKSLATNINDAYAKREKLLLKKNKQLNSLKKEAKKIQTATGTIRMRQQKEILNLRNQNERYFYAIVGGVVLLLMLFVWVVACSLTPK